MRWWTTTLGILPMFMLAGCGSSVLLVGGEGGARGGEGGSGDVGGSGPDTPELSNCAIVDVAVGSKHRCARAEDGTVWCWGAWGRLGACESTDSGSPRRVPLDQPAVDVAAGPDHTCAVLADTTVACWGWDAEDQCGGQFVEDWVRLPTLVVDEEGAPFTGAAAIAAGDTFSCAVSTSGMVWCWGGNGSGVAGADTSVVVSSPHPVPIPSLTGVTRLAAGDLHACAVDGEANLWCWGINYDGQLGDGTTDVRYEPVLVSADVIDVGAGLDHTCLVDDQGRPFCWGDNEYSQLGDGTQEGKLTPTAVAPPASEPWPAVTALGVGKRHSCALTMDARIVCWGTKGLSGTSFPQLVMLNKPAIDVEGGESGKCVVQLDGTLWCDGPVGFPNDFCGSTLLEPDECD